MRFLTYFMEQRRDEVFSASVLHLTGGRRNRASHRHPGHVQVLVLNVPGMFADANKCLINLCTPIDLHMVYTPGMYIALYFTRTHKRQNTRSHHMYVLCAPW